MEVCRIAVEQSVHYHVEAEKLRFAAWQKETVKTRKKWTPELDTQSICMMVDDLAGQQIEFVRREWKQDQ